MAGKEKVDIKRSDQFQEVDEELTRVMAELDFTIERVSAIFEGAVDENSPAVLPEPESEHTDEPISAAQEDASVENDEPASEAVSASSPGSEVNASKAD